MINKIKEHKNFIIYGFGQIINLLTPLIVSPYLIKECGIENFGKTGVATSIFVIISLFIDFGSSLLGVREISINKNNKKHIQNYLETVFALKIVIFIVLLIGIVTATIIIGNKIDNKLYLLSLTFLLGQVFNPLWIYQGKEDFKTSNFIIFFSKGLYILFIFLMIKKPEHYIYIIFLLGLSNTITYFYFFIKIYINNKLSLSTVTYKDLKKEFLNTYSILLSNIFISIYSNSPIIIVKYILGDYYAGIYKIADMFLMVFRSYLSVFFNVSFPKFCSLQAKNIEEGLNYLKKINGLNLIFLFFLSVFLYLMSVIYISNFCLSKKAVDSILFCNKFLFIPLIIALNIPFYQTIIFENQQKIISKIIFISTCIMLLICYLLTSKYHIYGTLISIYISEILTTTLIIIIYFRRRSNTIINKI